MQLFVKISTKLCWSRKYLIFGRTLYLKQHVWEPTTFLWGLFCWTAEWVDAVDQCVSSPPLPQMVPVPLVSETNTNSHLHETYDTHWKKQQPLGLNLEEEEILLGSKYFHFSYNYIKINLQQGPLWVYLQSSVPLPQSRTSHSPAGTSSQPGAYFGGDTVGIKT